MRVSAGNHVAKNVAERVAHLFDQMALVCPSSVEVVSLVVVNEVHERSTRGRHHLMTRSHT